MACHIFNLQSRQLYIGYRVMSCVEIKKILQGKIYYKNILLHCSVLALLNSVFMCLNVCIAV